MILFSTAIELLHLSHKLQIISSLVMRVLDQQIVYISKKWPQFKQIGYHLRVERVKK